MRFRSRRLATLVAQRLPWAVGQRTVTARSIEVLRPGIMPAAIHTAVVRALEAPAFRPWTITSVEPELQLRRTRPEPRARTRAMLGSHRLGSP